MDLKGNLLIIDDEHELLEKMAQLLEDLPDKVFTAANASQALEVIRNNKIHYFNIV